MQGSTGTNKLVHLLFYSLLILTIIFFISRQIVFLNPAILILIILSGYLAGLIFFKPLVGILLFPFAYFFSPISIPHIGSIGKLMVGYVLIVFCTHHILPRSQKRMSRQIKFNKRILLLFYAFFFINVLSLYNSDFSLSEGIINVVSFFSKGMTVYLVFRLINSKKELYFCLYSLIAYLMLIVFGSYIMAWTYGSFFVIRFYGYGMYGEGIVNYTILAAANQVSRITLLLMPIIYISSYSQRKKILQYLIKILGFAGFTLPFMAISRFAISVIMLIMVAIFLRKKYKGEIIILLVFGMLLFSTTHVKGRFIQAIREGYSTGKRNLTAEASLQSFKEHPLLGTGIGSSSIQLEKYGGPIRFSGAVEAEHNTFLVILVESGVLGLSIFIVLVFYCMLYFLKQFRKMEDDPLKDLFFSLILSISGFLVVSITGGSINDNIFWYILGLAFAMVKVEKSGWDYLMVEKNRG